MSNNISKNKSTYISQYEQILHSYKTASGKNDAIRSIKEVQYDSGPHVSKDTAQKIYAKLAHDFGSIGRKR